MKLVRMLQTASLMLALLLTAQARADIWGYIDEKGVAHFAAEKLDARYELYFKAGTSFDTQQGVAAPAASGASSANSAYARSVTVPSHKSKLLAFFEVSPAFKQVRHHMREASKANNIDFELLQALIATESGFDVDAVSPKGAVGLMQIMPATAERHGLQGNAKEPIEKKLTDPKTNIRLGSRHLRMLMNMYPQRLDLVLAAYNAGEGAVQRYGNKIPPFKETQNYVLTVMQIYESLKPPSLVPVAKKSEPQQPNRVRMEFPGSISGRGNMVPPLSGTPNAPGVPSVPNNLAAPSVASGGPSADKR
jgi:soluble lytic murein transglycosylase-like protein